MAIITLDALMTAEAILPSCKPSYATEAFVMMEIISTPGAISRVTSQLTAPSTILVTFPFSTLRALIFIVAGFFQTSRRIANRIAIEIQRRTKIISRQLRTPPKEVFSTLIWIRPAA
jgi:hypothetical protein